MSPRTLPSALTGDVTLPWNGYVVLDEPVYRPRHRPRSRHPLPAPLDDDIAHEPLFICLRGKGQ